MLLELAAFVVAVAGSGLVSSAPGRPGQQGGDGVVGGKEHGVEEAAEFVDAQLDQPRRRGLVVAFDGGGHGEEGVGEHGQGGPAVPGGSASDLERPAFDVTGGVDVDVAGVSLRVGARTPA